MLGVHYNLLVMGCNSLLRMIINITLIKLCLALLNLPSYPIAKGVWWLLPVHCCTCSYDAYSSDSWSFGCLAYASLLSWLVAYTRVNHYYLSLL